MPGSLDPRPGLGGGARVKLGRGAVVVVELAPQGLRARGSLIDHLRSIDKRRIRRALGEVAPEEIAAIDEGLAAFLGLGGRLHGALVD